MRERDQTARRVALVLTVAGPARPVRGRAGGCALDGHGGVIVLVLVAYRTLTAFTRRTCVSNKQ